MKKLAIVTIISLSINAFLILKGRGEFICTLLPMAASLWIGLPLLLVSTILFVFATRRNDSNKQHLAQFGLCVVIIIFSTLISIPGGRVVLERDKAEAIMFCNQLIVELDQTRRTTGVYPITIPEIIKNRTVPRLLRGQKFYSSDGTTFFFNIIYPDTLMGGIQLTSQNRTWIHWH